MVYIFTPREILSRIDQLLIDLGYAKASSDANELREYILARVIERIYLVCMYPLRDPIKDSVFDKVDALYRDEVNGYPYKLDQDVGSNTLFPILRSTGLNLHSRVRVQKSQVTICPE